MTKNLVFMRLIALFGCSNFRKLCEDDTPMVRRAASGKLGVSFFILYLVVNDSYIKLSFFALVYKIRVSLSFA